ncbi:MAG: DUF2269 family protein [Acidimicrobiia bacterium]
MYQFLLFLHIAAAAAWIGATVRQFAEAPVARAGQPVARALWHRNQVAMGTRLFAPAAVVVLVSGIWMVVSNDAVGFGTPFISIGFAAVIFGVAVGPAVFGKRGEAAAAKLDEGDVAGADAIAKKTRPIELLDLAILLVTLAAMVWKWGL